MDCGSPRPSLCWCPLSARNFVTFSGLGLDLEENMAILQVDMVKLRWFFQKAFIARPACMARLHPKASDWLV